MTDISLTKKTRTNGGGGGELGGSCIVSVCIYFVSRAWASPLRKRQVDVELGEWCRGRVCVCFKAATGGYSRTIGSPYIHLREGRDHVIVTVTDTHTDKKRTGGCVPVAASPSGGPSVSVSGFAGETVSPFSSQAVGWAAII